MNDVTGPLLAADGPPVLVTGATGFVGSHLVEQLRGRGVPVRGLVRPETSSDWLEARGVEIVRGDLLDPDSLDAACAGCAGVFHCAALAGWVRDPSRYRAVNVRGTASLLNAARRAGADRFVHTSSVVTVGERRGETATEDTPHRGTFLREYDRSKYEAEELARREAGRGLPVVITNPTGVIGPRSRGLTAQTLVAYLQRRLPALPDPDNRINFVHVDDVAAGTLAAWERGRPGERYILGGTNATIGEIFALCEKITGVPAPRRRLPRPVENVVAALLDLRATVTGEAPPLSRDLLRVARHGLVADSSKAERELGYRHRDLETALRQTLDWFIERGDDVEIGGST